jgi:hypothetical protein
VLAPLGTLMTAPPLDGETVGVGAGAGVEAHDAAVTQRVADMASAAHVSMRTFTSQAF